MFSANIVYGDTRRPTTRTTLVCTRLKCQGSWFQVLGLMVWGLGFGAHGVGARVQSAALSCRYSRPGCRGAAL
eukprot:310655-Rhodomonas_salina.2